MIALLFFILISECSEDSESSDLYWMCAKVVILLLTLWHGL